MAARARAFGLSIHYYSRNRRPPALEERLGARYWDSLDGMLAEVDIVSLHTPSTRDTFHYPRRRTARTAAAGAFVVNVSRPELIDEPALIGLIEAGRLSGAALDVFESAHCVDQRLLALARAGRAIPHPAHGLGKRWNRGSRWAKR